MRLKLGQGQEKNRGLQPCQRLEQATLSKQTLCMILRACWCRFLDVIFPVACRRLEGLLCRLRDVLCIGFHERSHASLGWPIGRAEDLHQVETAVIGACKLEVDNPHPIKLLDDIAGLEIAMAQCDLWRVSSQSTPGGNNLRLHFLHGGHLLWPQLGFP